VVGREEQKQILHCAYPTNEMFAGPQAAPFRMTG